MRSSGTSAASPPSCRPRRPSRPKKLDAIKAYRDASHPSAEAAISAIADIAVVLDVIASQIEAWSTSFESGAEDLGHRLLEIMMSNYVRLRWPRLFLLLQGVAAIEDATSTFGPGNNNLVSVGTSLMALIGFLWQPGKSLEQLDPGPENRPDHVSAAMEFIARVAVIVLGVLDRDDDIKVIKDVMSGWDAPAWISIRRSQAAAPTSSPTGCPPSRSVATVSSPQPSPQHWAG